MSLSAGTRETLLRLQQYATSLSTHPRRALSVPLRTELASIVAELSGDAHGTAGGVERAVSRVRALLAARGCGAWATRLAKKGVQKKKPASSDKEVVAQVVELHKLLFAVQLLCLVDAPAHTVDENDDDDDEEEEDKEDDVLMLWVDDHPENNRAEVEKYAPKFDVAFRQLTSSADVRSFLAARAPLKRRPASAFRLISDRHRDDEPGGQAGANLARWLRRERWFAPVLLYCGEASTVWGVADVLALQAEVSDLLVCCTQTQLELYCQTMVAAPKAAKPTAAAASTSTTPAAAVSAVAAAVDDEFASANGDDAEPFVSAATTTATTAAADDGSTTEEDPELHAAAEREAAERAAIEARAAAAKAAADAEAAAARARAAAEAKAKADAEAKAKAEAEAKARAEAEARARAEAAERERRLRQLARVEGEIPSDGRCGELLSFELRALDGRNEPCSEPLRAEAVCTSPREHVALVLTPHASGIWRCSVKLTVPGRYDVSVFSDAGPRAWLTAELRCAPGRVASVRVGVDGAAAVGQLCALWLAPLDVCGNVTLLETNRRLDVRLNQRVDAHDAPHSLDALAEPTAQAGQHRAVYFPTRAGVYDVRVAIRGADVTAPPPAVVHVSDAGERVDEPLVAAPSKRKLESPPAAAADGSAHADKRARPQDDSSAATVDMLEDAHEPRARAGDDDDDDADLNDIDAILEQVNKPSESPSARTQKMASDDDNGDDGAGEPTLAFGVLPKRHDTESDDDDDDGVGEPTLAFGALPKRLDRADDYDDDDHAAEPTLAFIPQRHNADADDDADVPVATLAFDVSARSGQPLNDRDLLGDDDDDDDDDMLDNEPTLAFEPTRKPPARAPVAAKRDAPPPKAFEFKSPLPAQKKPQAQQRGVDVFADIPLSEVRAAAAGEDADDDESPTADRTAFELPTLEI